MSADVLHYRLEGLSGALRDNVDAHLSTLELACGAPRWQAEALLPSTADAVRRALEALGHYRATVKTDLQQLDGCWNVRIDVQPGPAVRIAQLDLAATGPGKNEPGLRALFADSGLHLGDTLNQGRYTALKDKLERYARDHGYFDANFTAHTILIDPAAGTAKIRLTLDTGPRYDFGATTLHQYVLAPWLVHGFLGYREGEPYSSDAVIATQSTLVGTGYFDTVRLQTDSAHRKDRQVPMQLTLTGAPRYQLQAGAGYATDTGPRLRLNLHDRRVNRFGQRYTFSTQLSPVQSQTGIKYEIPLANPRTDWLTLNSGYQYEKTDTAITHSWTLGVSRTHQLGNHWLRRLSLEYLREGSFVAEQSLTSQLLIPGIGFSRTVVNATLYPTRGWSLATELRGSAKDAISNTSFAQLTLNLKGVHPLGNGRLFGRLDLGATAVSDIALLPASLRFFAGGDNSVRGYAYQSLGPVDATGSVTGGKYLATASLEYDHRLYGDFYWAAFYDVGNAFNALPLAPRRGAGLGINWHSPIGPIRIDAAHPLDGTGNYLFVHISMGPRL